MTSGTSKVVIKICEHCGSEFSANSWKRSPCCSDKCRHAVKLDKERQRNGTVPGEVKWRQKKCTRCSVLFWTSKGAALYCDLCAPTVKRERQKAYLYEYRRSGSRAVKNSIAAVESDKIFGTACYLCGREKFDDRRHHLHQKDGRPHNSAYSALYAIENPDEWVRLCMYCHKAAHWLMERGWSWSRIEREFGGK